jgi:hypothetical protein
MALLLAFWLLLVSCVLAASPSKICSINARNSILTQRIGVNECETVQLVITVLKLNTQAPSFCSSFFKIYNVLYKRVVNIYKWLITRIFTKIIKN